MNTSARRANPAILALAFLFLLRPAGAEAEIKQFTFSGVVSLVNNGQFQLDASVAVGTPFQGFYVFDTTGAVDSNPDPTVGDYRFRESRFGVVVKIGNYVFRTNPHHVDFLMEVVNRSTDHYLLRSYNNVCSQPLGVDHISWQLDNSTGNVLASDLLPTTPPTLSQWQSWFGLSVSGIDSSFLVRGQVTSIVETPVVKPLPPTVTLGQAVEVRWQSRMGYYYQIQRSAAQATQRPHWTDVGEPVLGDGTQMSGFFPAAPTNNVSYRVVFAAFQN